MAQPNLNKKFSHIFKFQQFLLYVKKMQSEKIANLSCWSVIGPNPEYNPTDTFSQFTNVEERNILHSIACYHRFLYFYCGN